MYGMQLWMKCFLFRSLKNHYVICLKIIGNSGKTSSKELVSKGTKEINEILLLI